MAWDRHPEAINPQPILLVLFRQHNDLKIESLRADTGMLPIQKKLLELTWIFPSTRDFRTHSIFTGLLVTIVPVGLDSTRLEPWILGTLEPGVSSCEVRNQPPAARRRITLCRRATN